MPASLVLAALVAAPAAPAAAASAADCAASELQRTQTRSGTVVRRLEEMPRGQPVLAVLREVDGCPVMGVVRAQVSAEGRESRGVVWVPAPEAAVRPALPARSR